MLSPTHPGQPPQHIWHHHPVYVVLVQHLQAAVLVRRLGVA